MTMQFEIKITVNSENNEISLSTESQITRGERNPSVHFLALTKYLNKQVLSDLESKLKLADEVADLIKLCIDNGIDGSEVD